MSEKSIVLPWAVCSPTDREDVSMFGCVDQFAAPEYDCHEGNEVGNQTRANPARGLTHHMAEGFYLMGRSIRNAKAIPPDRARPPKALRFLSLAGYR